MSVKHLRTRKFMAHEPDFRSAPAKMHDDRSRPLAGWPLGRRQEHRKSHGYEGAKDSTIYFSRGRKGCEGCVGRGSGHEPLHGGFVGPGMLDAACPGQVFTSPTPDLVLAAVEAADTGGGVLLVVKN